MLYRLHVIINLGRELLHVLPISIKFMKLNFNQKGNKNTYNNIILSLFFMHCAGLYCLSLDFYQIVVIRHIYNFKNGEW